MNTSSRRLVSGLASSLALVALAAEAQPAYLVRDLETSAVNSSSYPEELIVLRDRIYFTAFDYVHGQQVWRTDGTRRGTWVVRDVIRDTSPGIANGVVGSLEPGEERFWMVLDDGVSGFELWTSDGTAAGMRMVADLCPGPCGTFLQGRLFAWRDSVFFTPLEEDLGFEPWISDGTREGTRPLRDIVSGPESSGATGLARLDDVLLFSATDAEHGHELWRSDGTPEGTALVKDICPGDCTSLYFYPAAVVGGEAFFAAYEPVHGIELWRSDGTAAGTVLLKDTCPGPCSGNPRPFAVGDELLVVVQDRFLFNSDGTSDGTVQVASLPPEVYLTLDLLPFVRADGSPAAFFFTRFISTGGGQLWLTDGTTAGTRAVAELVDFREQAAVAGDRLIFSGGPYPYHEPWVSDGTAAGTHQLVGLRPGRQGSSPENFVSFGPSRVLFTAETERGVELWITDGTAAGTRLVRDVNGPDTSSRPQELTAVGGRLFFTAGTGEKEGALWTSDGSEDGTVLLSSSARFEELTAEGDRLFFVVGVDAVGRQPGVTDGTQEGTYLLWDSNRPGSIAYDLVTSGGVLYFAENTPEPRQLLWKSDGTPEGTEIVKDLGPAFNTDGCGVLCPACCTNLTTYPHDLTPAATGIYLVGGDVERGAELWRSDGTEAGTAVVVDLLPGPDSSFPAELTPVADLLYLTALAEVEGARRLWRTDGSAAGTAAVATAGEPRELTALGGRLFFVAAPEGSGDALYVVDAAAGEAEQVAALEVEGYPGYASNLTAVGGRLFFAVFTEATGQELWTSDGTAEGTGLVADVAPGVHGSYPRSFAPIDGRLYFAADDGARGREVWTSDGTAEGTCRIADVAPGREPSSPADFEAAGKRVFFAAADGVAGRELWALPRKDLCRLERLWETLASP